VAWLVACSRTIRVQYRPHKVPRKHHFAAVRTLRGFEFKIVPFLQILSIQCL